MNFQKYQIPKPQYYTSKLKPCPFCNNEAIVIDIQPL